MGLLDGILKALGLSDDKPKYKSMASQVKVVEEGKGAGVERTMHFDFVPPKRQYIIKVDGAYSVFSSKDEMPVEVRRSVESVESSDGADKTFVIIVDGEKRTFHSVDEMPEEMRSAVKLAEREAESR